MTKELTPLKLMGTMNVRLESNGRETTAKIRLIGDILPSIIERELSANLGLKLVQQKPEEAVMWIEEMRPASKRLN